MKRNRGITLIALIITIIVMVILAGVAITMAVGDSGVITRGETANATMEKKEIEETIQTSYYYDKENPGKLNYVDTKDAIKNNLEKSGYTVNFENGTDFPIVVTATGKTGEYTYKVEKIGKIMQEEKITNGENDLVVSDELKKYILGADGKGRNVLEIANENGFTKDPEDVNSTVYKNVRLVRTEYDDITSNQYCYIRYNREIYKFIFEEISDKNSEYYGQLRTVEESLEKVKDVSEGNLGKYVEYAGNTWIVLRDNANGVDLIAANVTDNEFALGDSDFNMARNLYNNAIETLTQACKDVTGLEIGGDILNIRSVGGPEVDETDMTKTVVFNKLSQFKPLEGVIFDNFEGEDYGLKIGDEKYLDDYEQMKKLWIINPDNSFIDSEISYWLASRYVWESGDWRVHFCIRYLSCTGEINDNKDFLMVEQYIQNDENKIVGRSERQSEFVRPVITLKSGVLDEAIQEGTIDDPIILD